MNSKAPGSAGGWLLFVVGLFLWLILRALWVKINLPEGIEIKADRAPELFAMVDGLRRQLNAPPFRHVLITDDFNAGVLQQPRLGIFGWPRNYLRIGLPLMKSLTVEQFKAVLAHEFGHLAKGHGKASNWIYRQRLRWSRLLAVLDANESQGRFLFKPFLNWFVPYFNAYSFPMARANEYEADAASILLTSPQAAAEALTAVNVVSSYLEEQYWPGIHKQADEHPQPGFAPYFSMHREVITKLDEASARTWLQQALARQTDSTDTHPALKDRLKAINEPPCLALPAVGQAADGLLGSELATITECFDQRWQDTISPSWGRRYQEIQDGRRRLAELNARLESGAELTVQEAYDRAKLTETACNDPEGALSQFRILHQRAPDDAIVCLSLGARLLDRNDATGCALVERAMQLDEDATATSCKLLRDYHWRQDQKEVAHTWHERLNQRLQLEQAAANERNQVTLRDLFEPHGLSDKALSDLRDVLKSIPSLRKAYLVKKRVRYFAHSPCYVLGYKVTRWFELHNKSRVRKVLSQIKELAPFPGETLIINVEGDNYRFGRKFRWMRGARIV